MSVFYKAFDNDQHKTDWRHKSLDDNWHYVKNAFYKNVDNEWHPAWTYNWEPDEWNTCSKTCGGGMQTRTVPCMRNDGIKRDDIFCDGITKPPESQECNTQPCYGFSPLFWCDANWYSDWGSCYGWYGSAIISIGPLPAPFPQPPAIGNTPCQIARIGGLFTWNGGWHYGCPGTYNLKEIVTEEREYDIYHNYISCIDQKVRISSRIAYTDMRLINYYDGHVYSQWRGWGHPVYMPFMELQGTHEGNHTAGTLSYWFRSYYGRVKLPVGTDRIPFQWQLLQGRNAHSATALTGSHFNLVPV